MKIFDTSHATEGYRILNWEVVTPYYSTHSLTIMQGISEV